MLFRPVPIAIRLRRLRAAGHLTPHAYAVADTLLWDCRLSGCDTTQVGYARIAELAGVCRSTVAESIQRLRDLGVLTWKKTRLRVKWALGIASRQWRNVYQFLPPPPTESATPPTVRIEVSKTGAREGKKPAAGPTWWRIQPAEEGEAGLIAALAAMRSG